MSDDEARDHGARRGTRTHRRRLRAAVTLAAGAALLLTACSGGGSTSEKVASKAPTTLSGTVSLWHFFTDREAGVIQTAVNGFEKANPGVTVQVHSGQDDEKLTKAIASGQNVDVGISYSTDIVGNFCQSGAFRDLGPYIARDKVSLDQFPDTVRSYTEFNGTRCAMPMLADVYGLYYNKDILKKYGYTTPPKTLSELTAMAVKMTTYNKDGSIKTLGFDPLQGWGENAAAHYAPLANATWLNSDLSSAVGSSQGWPTLLTWQKQFVNTIGYDKLQRFTAGLGQEFSADNAFQTGQVAMMMDGEYRTAFIKDQAPKLDYGTAPMPVADTMSDLYGSGYITGNIAGIAKGSQNPELAWALLKYLTTDTQAVVTLANGLGNVPTTKDALASPSLQLPSQFATFLSIMQNPKSSTTPPSPVGGGYQQTLQQFWNDWQSGKQTDLQAGLKNVDKQINDAISLAKQ